MLVPKASLAIENLDLRQQLAVFKHHCKRPSQSWRTFLDNHVPDIAACDVFTVPTVTFRVLYVFIALRHNRRQVVHFNVTANPSAPLTAQQRSVPDALAKPTSLVST